MECSKREREKKKTVRLNRWMSITTEHPIIYLLLSPKIQMVWHQIVEWFNNITNWCDSIAKRLCKNSIGQIKTPKCGTFHWYYTKKYVILNVCVLFFFCLPLFKLEAICNTLHKEPIWGWKWDRIRSFCFCFCFCICHPYSKKVDYVLSTVWMPYYRDHISQLLI